MADITKIRLSGSTYNIKDENALHTLDSTVTSGGTNAVQGSGIYNAIASALESVAEQGYQTSGDVQNAISGKADTTAVTQSIEAATSGKVDTTAYTAYTAATEVTLGNKADKTEIPAVSGYADAVAYNSTSKYVEFFHGGTGGTVVYSYDASPFLIDGMVSNVEIKNVTISGESVTCLVISFNTDAGKQDINIPISQIFDASNYYTTAETDSKIAEATSGKVDTSTFNTYSGSVETALSGKMDTASAYTKSETNDAISGYTTGYTYDKQTIDDKIASGGTFDPTQYYNKTATDALLAGKNQVITLDNETLVIS